MIIKRHNSIKRRKAIPAKRSAIDVLKGTPGVWRMTERERMEMTISCRDTDYISKVKDAGKFKSMNGKELQVMHNGLLVESGGYNGEWMAEIITALNGHHEPQEEKAFYEVMKRIGSGATMIELGAFWSYYSIWFNTQIKDAVNVCCEPDPSNLALGGRNAELNKAKINFVRSAAGSQDGSVVDVVMESTGKQEKVTVRSVDSLVAEYKLKRLDLLHMDVQGFELDTLKGAQKSIKSGKIRFLFVSTHHYLVSNDMNTHGKCIEFIKSNGGHIIVSHTVAESFSGDGLIVASFSDVDKDFQINTSLNHTDQSLFRPYEEDLAILEVAYNNG